MANEFKIRKGLIVTGASGGTVVDIQGSQGQLFSVTDDLSGSIFAVSDISGVPILDINSSGTSLFTGLVSGITPVDAANFVTKAYVDGSGGGTGPFLPLAGGTLTGALGIGVTPSNGYSLDITPSAGNILRSTRGSSVMGSYQSLNGPAYSGTISNDNFVLISNDIARLTLNADGTTRIHNSTSIGTTVAPTRTLDVRGTGMSIFGTGGNTELMLRGQVEGTGTVRNLGSWHISVRGDVAGNNDDLKLLRFITGTYSGWSMVVQNTTGKMAIGTNTLPSDYRLIIEDSSEDLLRLHNSTDGLDALISFTNPGGTLGRIQGIDNGGLGFDVGNNAGGIVSNAMFIKNNGNVGIGTTSPSAHLNVHKNALSPAIIELSNTVVSGNDGVVVAQIKANTVAEELTRIETQNSSNSHDNGNLLFYNRNGYTNTFAESMRITGEGDVGIGTSNPSSKLEIAGKATSTSTVSTDAATTLVTKDYVDSSAGNPSYFRQGHKSHALTNAFTTCLTVNLNSHTGCYVTVCCFGDWSSHSSAAYRGEFFLQNGANAYSEPGIILRQDDNTSNGADQIVCQILDPTSSSNPKDFEIQIRTTATTGTTGFTGLITFTVQGKFNSVT